ncbi:uncharacterized protein LOC130921277 isoform X3 [Corythoichthys intestinalis]|uniref:uncharacterized protein LOC130921277 isoform X3 n=1 Tax=Corythoichthys intestinalis TaxID=161448 RepID=UPI0025A4DE3D|nr:uncharacterized protein LOC130921277 isoform X3 [Corythoichthys intestinalis]
MCNPTHIIQDEKSTMPYIKQEAEPETPSIKEEEQEDEITKSPMTVGVKSEEDDSSFHHLKLKDIPGELHPEMYDPTHVIQEEKSEMLYVKQEGELDIFYVKEEEQEEKITTFPLTVIVKSDEDEGPSKETGALTLLSDGSFYHLKPNENMHI